MTIYREWLDTLESRDALWRDLGKLEKWADRIRNIRANANPTDGVEEPCMSVQAGGQLARKHMQKRYLGVLVYSGLNMSQQGVVAKESQLYAELQ